MIDGSDRSRFLHGKSPAVLYLWYKSEEHDLFDTVCQKLNDSVGIDTSASQNGEGGRTKRNKKGSSSEDTEGFTNMIQIMESANTLASNNLKFEQHKLKVEERMHLESRVDRLKRDKREIEAQSDALRRDGRTDSLEYTRLYEELLDIKDGIRSNKRRLDALYN